MTEAQILRAILKRLGTEPDLRIFRNTVGFTKEGSRSIAYGLGKGSPDLVGILAPHGRWFALEVKSATGTLRKEQRVWLGMIRALGGHAAVVRSVEDAVYELNVARISGNS